MRVNLTKKQSLPSNEQNVPSIDLTVFLHHERVFIPDTDIPAGVNKFQYLHSVCEQLKEITGKEYIDIPVFVSEDELFEKGIYPDAIEGQYIQPCPALLDKNGEYVFNNDTVYDHAGKPWHVQYYFHNGIKILLDPKNLHDKKLFEIPENLSAYSKKQVLIQDKKNVTAEDIHSSSVDSVVAVIQDFDQQALTETPAADVQMSLEDDPMNNRAVVFLYTLNARVNMLAVMFVCAVRVLFPGFINMAKSFNIVQSFGLFSEIFRMLEVLLPILNHVLFYYALLHMAVLCLKLFYIAIPIAREPLSRIFKWDLTKKP